jgi:hypothetical protein
MPVVVHPDVMSHRDAWAGFGKALFIENMDKRKHTGRRVRELAPLFRDYPEAKLCFDIGHVRQVDPTMTEARLILEAFGDRLAEVHISEVNTSSRHDPLSLSAINAFQSVAHLIPEHVPIVLETLIDQGESDELSEIAKARRALSASPVLSLTDA